ncbi:AraC family transcriptional regulator [Paenibacillus glucanolyticus]|uniref:AraC family transcriptional regulator n=1 Tax=Paenibacillus glucanolyticus TaxID=59843 RepID=A0A163JCH6_9BACL|nr:AraC family transcriptional regulator [Paenibacillus glucanolyticus]KZS46504.1 AraC family transcriptional regulator [Paenibacillus glucanolyticus]
MTVNQRPSREEYFNNPAHFETQLGLWIFKSGSHPFFTEKVGPRSVEFYSIHFVASGKVRFGWDGSSVSLSEGDLFCLFPGSVYTYAKDCDQPSTMITWTAFMGELMPSILKHVDLCPERPYRQNAFRDDALAVIKEIQGLLRQPQQDHSLQLMSLGFQLIHSIDPNRNQRHPASSSASDWLESVPGYMKLYCTENLSVEELAAWAGVHRSHFTRAFTRRYGISPSRYMQQLIMEKATRLLSAEGTSITHTALSLGYSDLFTFSRAFTRYFGMTPSAFVKGHRSSSTARE